MLVKIIFAFTTVFLAVSAASYFAYPKIFPTNQQDSLPSQNLTFKDSIYNFQIQYPQHIKIGYVQDGYIPLYIPSSTEPFASIETNYDKPLKSTNGYEQNFEEFAKNTTGCAADSEEASSFCVPKNIKNFSSDNGIKGFIITFDKTLNYHKDNRQEKEIFGPVYVFDISRQTNFKQRSLKITPAINFELSESDHFDLEKIAKSLTFTND